MKAWQWVALAGVAILVIVVIAKVESPTPALSTGSSGLNTALGGLGNFLGGLAKGSSGTPTKVSAPSGNPFFSTPGSSGVETPQQQAANAAWGKQYSQEMASTGEVASQNAGSGGVSMGGGLSTSDPLGIGTLTAPTFDIGTGGADFSTV